MKSKRRHYLINKPFQFGYTANVLLLQLFGFIASAGVVSWIILIALNGRLTCSLDRMFLIQFGIIVAVVAAGVVCWTIRYSHAIAGPVFKCRRIMLDAAAGKLPEYPVVFRKRDAFKELAEDLNCLLDAVRADREKLDGLSRDLGVLEVLIESGEMGLAECREALRGMRERLWGETGGQVSGNPVAGVEPAAPVPPMVCPACVVTAEGAAGFARLDGPKGESGL